MIVRVSVKQSLVIHLTRGLTYHIYLRLTIQLTLMVTFETSVKFSVTIFHYAL